MILKPKSLMQLEHIKKDTPFAVTPLGHDFSIM